MTISTTSLSRWNYAAAAVHITATIAAALLLKSDSKRFVQMIRLKFDSNAPVSESRVDVPVDIENDAKVDLKFVVVLFFAITAVAHFLYASDFFGLGWYSTHIINFGWNPYRWFEYSLSASLMIYLITAVSGTKDQVTAISSALITPGIMINGFTTERALSQNSLSQWSRSPSGSKPKVDAEIVFSNLIPAWILFGVHWYVILSNYTKIIEESKIAGKTIDPSVSFMVFSQLIFFSLFGVIQTIQVLRWFTAYAGRVEPDFWVYEKSYIALSAVTKLLLAGTVAYALR